jgi:hypothetical protein
MQRYEIMPFAKGEAQAVELPGPVRLTVTTSPRHGVDHPDVSERLRALGHGGLFTFNELVATSEWSQELPPADASVA